MKKVTKTIIKKYDGEGNLLEHTETTTEETIEKKYNPYTIPYNPNIIYTNTERFI